MADFVERARQLMLEQTEKNRAPSWLLTELAVEKGRQLAKKHDVSEEAGLQALDEFEDKWKDKYAYAIKSWRTNWPRLATFFKYPPEIRKLIYTTNPVESFNRTVRKVTKTKSSFPTDDALIKLLYLITMDATERWTLSIRDWPQIMQQLTIHYGDRMEEFM